MASDCYLPVAANGQWLLLLLLIVSDCYCYLPVAANGQWLLLTCYC